MLEGWDIGFEWERVEMGGVLYEYWDGSIRVIRWI